MDEAQFEFAARLAEREIETAIEKANHAKPLPHVGTCYNCQEPIGPALRFCDSYCRDDYDARVKAARIAGRPQGSDTPPGEG